MLRGWGVKKKNGPPDSGPDGKRLAMIPAISSGSPCGTSLLVLHLAVLWELARL